MRVPRDAIIRDEKLVSYLLVPRRQNDKAKFLAQAGFGRENAEALRSAIRALVRRAEAMEEGSNEYGEFFRVEGTLTGPEGDLEVVTIWLRWRLDNSFHFVTLKPRKGRRR